jgi:hypothetical protein
MIEDLVREVMTKFCPITVILGLTAELTRDITME